VQQPSEQQVSSQGQATRWTRRFRWALIVLFAFLAFEAVLVAVALQGPWLVLLAPGAVCGLKAAESYRSTGGR
jgi:hypothetical protein